MTASRFRVAFIGVDHPHGAGWRESLALLADEIELVALVPRFNGGLTSLEERYAHLPRFETVEDLIVWGEFDGAVICLPNDETVTTIVSLAKAGRHVLMEKPGAASAAEFEPAPKAIEHTGVAFQSGYLWRYDPGAERLHAMIAEQRMGKLISIEMSYATSDVKRRGPDHYLFDAAISGRGFMNWLACHWLDLLLYLTAQKVVGVTSRIGIFGATASQVEDGGMAILDLAGGGLASFTGGYWLPRWAGESQWVLRGSERWVHWRPAHPASGGLLEIHGPQPQFLAMNESFLIPEDKTPGYGGARMLSLLRDWIAVARGQKTACRNTPQSTLATLQLLDAIYAASEQGRRVECAIG